MSRENIESVQRVQSTNVNVGAAVSDDATMKWAVDSRKWRLELENRLRNKYFDSKSQEWVQKGYYLKGADGQYQLGADGKPLLHPLPPMLSEEGISAMLAIVDNYSEKHVVLSNLDIEFIKRLIRTGISRLVFRTLQINYYNWQVQNISVVAAIIRDACFISLARASGFRTANLLKTTRLVEERNVQGGQKQGGLLPIKPWG